MRLTESLVLRKDHHKTILIEQSRTNIRFAKSYSNIFANFKFAYNKQNRKVTNLLMNINNNNNNK